MCGYNNVFDQFDTRNSDDVLAMQQALLEVEKDRTFMAILQERLTTGGQIDPRTTAQMNALQERIRVTDDMLAARNPARNGGNSMHVHVGLPTPTDPTAQQRPGVLTMLFGGAQQVPPQQAQAIDTAAEDKE